MITVLAWPYKFRELMWRCWTTRPQVTPLAVPRYRKNIVTSNQLLIHIKDRITFDVAVTSLESLSRRAARDHPSVSVGTTIFTL